MAALSPAFATAVIWNRLEQPLKLETKPYKRLEDDRTSEAYEPSLWCRPETGACLSTCRLDLLTPRPRTLGYVKLVEQPAAVVRRVAYR